MKIVLSVAYWGDTASPSSPPSPPLVTPAIFCTSVTGVPLGPVSASDTFSSRLLSRSVTSAVPSGRKSNPHGTARSRATTSTAACPSSDVPLGDIDGLGSFGGVPVWSGGGGPKLHPVSRLVTSTSAAAYLATVTASAYPGAASGQGPRSR